MFINTTYRSKDVEIMDDLEMEGPMLIKTLDQIAKINKWLGGNKLTIDGIKKMVKQLDKDQSISIVDMGCGNGDMLREAADFAHQHGYTFKLTGIDANQATIDYAKELSVNYPEINYLKEDVLSDKFNHQSYDIALCTLFLHHFEDDVAMSFIHNLVKNAKLGVVINDLHRHWLAYYLFRFLTFFINNPMVKTDGLISILRGFKREDLEQFAEKINYKSIISWRWAFRYQWIINKV